MAAYVIANFEITDPASFKAYPAPTVLSLQAHDAEILVADYESESIEGSPGSVTVVLRFESKEAVHAWYNSPEYQKVVQLRTDNSDGLLVIADEYDPEAVARILQSF